MAGAIHLRTTSEPGEFRTGIAGANRRPTNGYPEQSLVGEGAALTKLVAGEAKQMPPIMDELVDRGPIEQSCRALFDTNEVDSQRKRKTREDSPRQQFAHGDCNRATDC